MLNGTQTRKLTLNNNILITWIMCAQSSLQSDKYPIRNAMLLLLFVLPVICELNKTECNYIDYPRIFDDWYKKKFKTMGFPALGKHQSPCHGLHGAQEISSAIL